MITNCCSPISQNSIVNRLLISLSCSAACSVMDQNILHKLLNDPVTHIPIYGKPQHRHAAFWCFFREPEHLDHKKDACQASRTNLSRRTWSRQTPAIVSQSKQKQCLTEEPRKTIGDLFLGSRWGGLVGGVRGEDTHAHKVRARFKHSRCLPRYTRFPKKGFFIRGLAVYI